MTVLQVISTYAKPYVVPIIIVIILALGLEGWKVYQNYLGKHQSQLQQDYVKSQQQVKDITAEYDKLAKAKKDVETANAKLADDADYWRKQAQNTPIPPKPPTPPTDDITLIADLKVAGVEFVPVAETPLNNYSTGKQNLPIIWTWNKEALRVPGLEEKITVTSTALDKQVVLANGLNQQIVITDKMIDDANKREEVRKTEQINLTEQIKLKDKQIIVAETNGWIRIAIAVPATWFVAKQVYKK